MLQRQIEEAVPADANLRSRPPLQAPQRGDAAPPRLRVRRATMETGDGVCLWGEKCWENTAGQSANVFPCGGRRTESSREGSEKPNSSGDVCFLYLLRAAQVKTNNVASVPGAFATLNRATQTGGIGETMSSLLKADYQDRHLDNGTRV